MMLSAIGFWAFFSFLYLMLGCLFVNIIRLFYEIKIPLRILILFFWPVLWPVVFFYMVWYAFKSAFE